MSHSVLPLVLSQLVVLAVAGLLIWRMLAAKRRREEAFHATPDSDGAVEIPVRATLSRGGFLAAQTRNSMNPGFAVGRQGLRIKVVRTTEVPFGTIRQVDARKTITGGTALIFQIDSRIYVARFGDAGLAQRALTLMPPGVPLTEEAATVRDGHAGAAAKGTKRYRGPI